MKEKPIAIVIMLLGGAVASICCILMRIKLLYTLLIVLGTLLVFMVIGLIVNRIYSGIKAEIAEKEKEEAWRLEQERLAALEAEEEEERRREEEENGEASGESEDDDWNNAGAFDGNE